EKLLLEREASVEFAYLWGQYCQITESIRGLLLVAKRRQEDEKKDKTNEKRRARAPNTNAQRKLWLHWKQYCAGRGWSVKEAEFRFVEAMYGIASGERLPPDGFPREWFIPCCGDAQTQKDQKGTTRSIRQRLPDAFKRGRKGDVKLLSPDDPTKIPF